MTGLGRLVAAMLLTVPLSACLDSPKTLVDQYRIYPQDEFGDGHYLICKLGCEGNPKIEGVAFVKWNDRFIIARKKGMPKTWCVVKARGERLRCCNGDTLVKALSEQELKKYLESEGVGRLKEKSFE